jgi:hypothetical protein
MFFQMQVTFEVHFYFVGFFGILYHVFTKFQIQTTLVLDMIIFSFVTQSTRISNTQCVYAIVSNNLLSLNKMVLFFS